MSKSENLYSAARELIPGGVNSPVRAFTGVGGTPLFIEKADGAYLYDVDGKAYIDYVGSWGPMVLGHNHPAIRNAVIEAAELQKVAPVRPEESAARQNEQRPRAAGEAGEVFARLEVVTDILRGVKIIGRDKVGGKSALRHRTAQRRELFCGGHHGFLLLCCHYCSAFIVYRGAGFVKPSLDKRRGSVYNIFTYNVLVCAAVGPEGRRRAAHRKETT